MPALSSEIDTDSDTFVSNYEVQSAAVAALNEQLQAVAAGGGERYVKRHHDRGRLLARERIELLLDRDAPFLELSSLAAWGTQFNVGAAIVTGVGWSVAPNA
ncbi:acetyl-/propionyl-CoA carboxylase beta subunit accD2 [Mycolicibacterium fortuitum]|uniref:Acetyl-/propionyl-CoA carboxylase beta subunit accD2 n=1 Tax=Mycolicibacterium fortuitum TaxID=1766 RepID=A0A378U5K2_MYCFO|nr:acetyl-/propionyl-CoA carboxylase beta subunit accD2 [Mycolicibacterium fortuitum]